MEKPSSVAVVGQRLPVGFRFCPTDSELLAYYLKRRAFNLPLPASIIPDLDALRLDPSDLPGDWKEKRYFFGHGNWSGGNQCDRICSTRSGYWKRLGRATKIVAPGTNLAIGFRRSRAFFRGKPRRAPSSTPWIMHEFRLLAADTNPSSSQNLGDWAVYCIFQKNRRFSRRNAAVLEDLSSHGSGGDVADREEIRVGEDSSDVGPPLPSSSCSSSCASGIIVGFSNNRLQEQEESSRSPCIGCS